MKRVIVLFLTCLIYSAGYTQYQSNIHKDSVLSTMKRATAFMSEKVSCKGGYVWSYLPDLSRRWGEMEAKKTMVWFQPPGTATMGHLFLDAYHATKDEYYYQIALYTAKALITGQHQSGGWNYCTDFAGEKSLEDWYKTFGANGWRLEEFHHYYGNATFDDGGTAESAIFLLRMYLEKGDAEIKTALDKAIRFVLDSQYPIGGWPQRFPHAKEYSVKGKPDYTSYITFNDDVAERNIDFLIMCYQTLGDKSLLDPIQRAMDAFVQLQMPMPQPGWAMQYTVDLKPATARSYEPVALSTAATENNLFQLMDFYRLTGNKKYIERIPETMDWLEGLRLPDSLIEENRTHPLFVEIGTNKPIFLHRTGSNVVNGKYFYNYNPRNVVSHYRSMRVVLLDSLRSQYNSLKTLSPEVVTKGSLLKTGEKVELPRYFSRREIKISDLNTKHLHNENASEDQVKKVISVLNKDGYWVTPLVTTTNPYIGPGPKKVTPGDYSTQRVGDKFDTSPYFIKDKPIDGISTGVYIKNMGVLIEYLETINQ